MNEERNNKHQANQVLLSVLAVAILVLAVVGVSFAFFQYSKQGSTTNTISTGSLVFKYEEGKAGITLTNAVPTADPTDASAGENDTFDFTVTSTISGTMQIDYEISVKDVSTDPDTAGHVEERNYLDSKYVKMALYQGTNASTFTEAAVKTDYYDKLGASTLNSGAKTLYSSQFTGADASGVKQTHYYRFKMWFATEDAEGEKTMMTSDMCTNEDYMSGAEEIPCDDPVYGENGSNETKGVYASKKGTNGKTFIARLDVNAKDHTAGA